MRSSNRYYVYTDWGNFWTNGTSYTAPTSAASGSHAVYVYAYDNAGNAAGSGWIYGYVDKTVPNTPSINSPGAGSSQSGNFSVSVSNDADAHSGLAGCYYHVYDSGVGWTRWAVGRTCNSSFTVTVGTGQDCRTNSGTCTVYAYSLDAVGNYSAYQTRAFSINTVPDFGYAGTGSIVNNAGGSGNCENYNNNGVCLFYGVGHSINVYICGLYNGQEYGPTDQCRCSDYPGGAGCYWISSSSTEFSQFRFGSTNYYRINNITWPLNGSNQTYCKIQMDYYTGGGYPADWVVWRDESRCHAPNAPSLVSPPNNSWINYNPTFTANVSASVGGSIQARFDLDANGGIDGDGGYVGSGSNSSWGPVSLPDTSGRAWQAKARDSGNREGPWSGAWTLKKDTVAPSATVSYTSGVIAGPGIPVTLTESDDRSGVASGEVQVSVDYGAWQFYQSTISDFTYTGSSGHAYQFRYQTRDAATNASAWSTGAAAIINRSPNVPDTITPNSPPHDTWINYNPIFSAVVTDPDSNNVRAYFYSPASTWGSWAASGGTSSTTALAVPDTSGTWWAAYAQDSYGATSGDSSWRYLKKDTVAPAATIGYTTGTIVGPGIPLTLTETDDRSGVASGEVQISINYAAWQAQSSTLSDFTYTGTPGQAYQFRYRSRDVAGNYSNWSAGGVVVINVAPNAPSTITPNSPPHDTWINYNPIFSAVVTDPDSNNVRAYFYSPASTWGSWAASGGTSSTTALAVPDTSGTWWAAYAQDSYGATSGDSSWRYLKKDTVIPVVNTASAEGAAFGTSVTSTDLNISPISFTASDVLSGLAVNGFVEYSSKPILSGVWGNWTALTQLSGSDNPSSFSFNCPGRPGCPVVTDQNDYRFRYQVVDRAGNWSVWKETGVVRVEVCPVPTTPNVTEGHGSPCINTAPTWSWPAVTGGTIDNYEVNRSWNLIPLIQPGLSYTESLTSGVYSLQVRAHNTCGSWGNLSLASTITIDQTPPATPSGLSPNSVCLAANSFAVSWDVPTDPAPNCGGVVNNYWIQISDSPSTNPDGSFVTAISDTYNTWFLITAVGGRATLSADLTSFMTSSPKKFYFHVKARDAAWNQSGWSSVVMMELENATVVTALNMTNINPAPITPLTQSFNITSDLVISQSGSICTSEQIVCHNWKIVRGPTTYEACEVCTTISGSPSPTSHSTNYTVSSCIPGGFQEEDLITLRTKVRDQNTGFEVNRETSPQVIRFSSWFQSVNGDVYGNRISETVAANPSGSYEPWLITNDASGFLTGGAAIAKNDVNVIDTDNGSFKASERTGADGNRWLLPSYPGGMSWPEVITKVTAGGGDLIYVAGGLTINAANSAAYNNKVVFVDGDINLSGDLVSGPGRGTPPALIAYLISNQRIIVDDTPTHPGNGTDMLKIRGGLYAKEGIDFQRTLGNNKFPAVVVWYDPNVFLYSLEQLATPRYTWREVTP